VPLGLGERPRRSIQFSPLGPKIPKRSVRPPRAHPGRRAIDHLLYQRLGFAPAPDLEQTVGQSGGKDIAALALDPELARGGDSFPCPKWME